MKKITLIVMIVAILTAVFASCTLDHALLVPFGRWENAELSLVLDIDPRINVGSDLPGSRARIFPGTYWIDGERTEVLALFTVNHLGEQEISIFRYSDRHANPIPSIYRGWNHQVRDNSLYLTVFDGTETVEIVLELIKEYEVD